MNIFKIKIKKKEFQLCFRKKHINFNGFKKTVIGGNFAPKTKLYSFGFIGIGCVTFYSTQQANMRNIVQNVNK